MSKLQHPRVRALLPTSVSAAQTFRSVQLHIHSAWRALACWIHAYMNSPLTGSERSWVSA